MRKDKTNWLFITPVVIFMATYSFYHFFYSYHLFFKEQVQLFLYTPDYILSYFNKPASLSRLCGDFLVQFFYLRGGGPLVLAIIFCVEWLLLRAVLIKNFSSEMAGWWALIPIAADFTLHLNLLHTPADSMGVILVMLIFLILSLHKHKTINKGIAIVLGILGYYLLGNAVLLLPFFLLFKKDQFKPLFVLMVLILVLLVPYVLRPNFLLTLEQTYLYPAFTVKSLMLPICIVIVFSMVRFLKSKSVFLIFAKPFVLVLIVVVGFVGIRLNANFDREKILTLDSETYFGNSSKVLRYAEKELIESRFATYYTNMALAEKGELPERLLEFYQPGIFGLLLPVSQHENWQSILFSNELFYLIGDMNFAQHSAMLGNTFSPYNRSSRMIKRLAEINMVTKDFEGAEKYLKMLTKTFFHKKWAEKRLAENNNESKKIWLAEKRSQIAKTDVIRTAFDYIKSIEFLVQQNPNNNVALDYLLCYHLLNKDLPAFQQAYDTYALKTESVPAKIYAEALLIILFRNNASEQEFEQYGINPEQLNNFVSYTELFEESKGELDKLQRKFGTTFWFYYHFATMKGGWDE